MYEQGHGRAVDDFHLCEIEAQARVGGLLFHSLLQQIPERTGILELERARELQHGHAVRKTLQLYREGAPLWSRGCMGRSDHALDYALVRLRAIVLPTWQHV